MSGLFPTTDQWRDLRSAWQERGDNPVAHYFALVRHRRRMRLPWWRRNLPIVFGLLAALLPLGVTWAIAFYGRDSVSDWPGFLTAVLLNSCGIWCCAWIASAVYDLLSSAVCLLSQPSRRQFLLQADGPLLTARTSPADLVLGMGLALVRPVLGPLICAASMLLLCVALTGPWSDAFAGINQVVAPSNDRWVQSLWLLPLALVGMLLSGLLSLWALFLLALVAGRGRKMETAAGMIAAVHTIGIVAFAAASIAIATWIE